ncbi:MAG: cation diffusion facilitator family transporter [Geminicoccaceae bacterium]
MSAAHHHHGHDHGVPSHDRAFAIGIALNLIYVVFEVVFGVVSGSLALLADAGHNLSDVLGLALAWGAAWLSRRQPTARRTYGYRRSSILAALANAMLLLVAVGAIAWEALRRLQAPGPIDTGVVLWVAALGVVVNTGTALLFMRGRERDLNVHGAFLHMVADAAVTVGVIAAALLIAATGWLWLDPAISLVIGAVILIGTWGLLRDSVDLALDAVPRGIDPVAVEGFLAEQPGVCEVHDLHIWGMSTTETALTAHLVRPGAAPDDGFLAQLRQELHARFDIDHATIQLEAGEPCPQAPAHVV